MTLLRLPSHVKILLRHSSADVRVRFAPSPTGYLHLGGLRTALYNYLFAKSMQGKFVLRIEDTDQSRLVPGAARQLEEALAWTGIIPDESPALGGDYGPYYQSERLNIYHQYAQQLLHKGLAYRCFCSEKRLELLKRESARTKQPNKYDRKCLHLPRSEVENKISSGQPHTIRFLLSPELQTFTDLVYGEFSHDVFATEGDPVIVKSDGFPTYHFANVVDDRLMKITHVLRGVEWQVSTPKHLLMYRAFGWDPPEFGHLPLIMNNDGTKLSKRQGDLHLESLRNAGYFPDSILNFVTLVGGGFEEKENNTEIVYNIDQLSRLFNIQKLNAHNCKIDLNKLDMLNRNVLKRRLANSKERSMMIKQCQDIIKNKMEELDLIPDNIVEDSVATHLDWAQDRISKLSDIVSEDLLFLWHLPNKANLKIALDTSTILDIIEILNEVHQTDKSITKGLKSLSKSKNIKFAELMRDIRILLTGLSEGPPVLEIVNILGKQKSIQRLQHFLDS